MIVEQSKNILLFAPRWVEIALVLLAAWLVAGALVGSSDKAKSFDLMDLQDGSQFKPDTVDVGYLQKIHLFGQTTVQGKTEATQAKETPVIASRLNIKLIGTVVAGEKSAAMVSLGGKKKQSVFFLEEEIQGNVFLKEVEAIAIVVDNHGKRERISLEAGKAIVSAAPARVASRPTVRPQKRISKRLDRGRLESQMRNFSTLLSQARVSPHFTNKKADGFTISEIVKGSLYEEIGLQNGDVIHKVNGEFVTSAEQAMRMYRELQTATFIDVEINRAGSIQQVNYAIQ